MVKYILMIFYKVKIKINNQIDSIVVEANSKLHAMQIVYNRGMTNVISAYKISSKSKTVLIRKKFNNKELISIFTTLNRLSNTSMSISEILKVFIKNNHSLHIKSVIQEILNSLENGQSLYESMLLFEDKFGVLILSMIKSGEINSNMSATFNEILEILTQIKHSKESFNKAIRYPIILLISTLLSFVAVFTIVIPQFETLFKNYNTSLPLFTKILIDISSFFNNYYLLILIFSLISIAIFIISYKLKSNFRYTIDNLILKIPLVGNLIIAFELYKFFLLLSRVYNVNQNIILSLDVASTSINNSYLSSKTTLIKLYLDRGYSISSSFEKIKLFDKTTLNIIKSSELSNVINRAFDDIRVINKDILENSLNSINSYIEPLLLIFIALFILLIALGIFIPLWDMGKIIA